jgi:Outer membrane protein beta-barrel domain
MILRLAVFLSLVSIATFGSEVIKISKDKLSMAVSHNKDSQWRVGEQVCVTSSRGQRICGRVSKVKKAGAICKMKEPLKGVYEGDEVDSVGGNEGIEESGEHPLEKEVDDEGESRSSNEYGHRVGSTHKLGLGVRGGVSLANVVTNAAVETTNRTGIDLGVLIDIPFGHSVFGLEPSLYFVQKGYETTNYARNLNYLDLRLLFKARVLRGGFTPVFYLGPYLGFLLSAETVTSTGSSDQKYLFKSIDFGLVSGLGFEFKFTPSVALGFSGYYSFAFVNQEEDASTTQSKNRTIHVLSHLIFHI